MRRIGLIIIALPFIAFSSKEVLTDSYTGFAYNLETNDLVYTEEFTDKFVDGRHLETNTDYFDAFGRKIARRTLEYSKFSFAPDFRTEDYRTGYVEGAEVTDEMIRLYFRKNKSSDFEEKLISVPRPAVVDGGFNNYIKANWEKLKQGQELVFHFTVPSKLDYFTLRARMMTLSSDQLKIKIEADKYLLRMIAEPIVITYSTATKRILSYEGKSNIAGSDGANFITKLIYPKKGP